jgi:adenylate cyclase
VFAWRKSPTRRALLIALAVLGLLVPLSLLKVGQSLENRVLDLGYRLRPAGPPPPDLLIVGIDEPSFKELQVAWPWPRRLHAALVDRLARMGARLVVFDVLFADTTRPEDDELLAAAVRRAGNVILGKAMEITRDPRFSRKMIIEPLPALRTGARAVGLMAITPDPDAVVRHFRLKLRGETTLSTAAAEHLKPPVDLPATLSGLINYAGPPRSIDTVSYYQILDTQHPLPENRVRGRIVLVGRMLEASVTPQSQADAFYTPFYASSGRLMSGVEVHAHILHTLLTGSWGRELSPFWQLSFALLVILGAAGVLSRRRLAPALAFLVILLFLTFGASLLLFLQWRLWMAPVLPGLSLVMVYVGTITWEYLLEYREKRWLRQAFGRYVSPALVETIIAHPDRLKLGGEEIEVTVLFADLAGFTGLSEEMPPEPLIQLLNDYFTTMTRIILAQRGTVDKFIGDAVMAVWGAPVPMADHAVLACQAALDMHTATGRLRETWRERGLPQLTVRMGLHSGRVLAGNVGSSDRFDYTVMGDTVNLASRLEGVNKRYGTEILVSEAACRQAAGHFLLRELDLVQVKGRQQPVTIYELVGPRAENAPAWLTAFHSGRAAYLARDWPRAREHFQETLHLKPEDPPARIFLERCRQYQDQPPPQGWQGVFVLEEK